MATFTNPGNRVDLLLTLARLSFPDAVRRANQPVAVAILIVLENRLLLGSYLDRPGGDSRGASGVLPLVRMLRGSRRLTPLGVLTVLETECLLRLKPVRLVLAIMVAFALVWVPTFGGLIAAAVLLLAAASAYASRRWQARVLKARGRELLLHDPAEDPPPASSRQPTTDPMRGPGLPSL